MGDRRVPFHMYELERSHLSRMYINQPVVKEVMSEYGGCLEPVL